MYAIIETGGKQYRVKPGDIIDIEKIAADAEGKVSFTHVLFMESEGNATIGTPHIQKAIVHGKLLDEVRGPKVIAFKYKRRKNYRRKVGHRQDYARVQITEIGGTHGS